MEENKKELQQGAAQAIENEELEEVSGGVIIHSTDESGNDMWFAQGDKTPYTQPFGSRGSCCPGKRKRIGPYKTKEEAIRAAKDEHLFGFYDCYVIDAD